MEHNENRIQARNIRICFEVYFHTFHIMLITLFPFTTGHIIRTAHTYVNE
jgi:hypothetical protein